MNFKENDWNYCVIVKLAPPEMKTTYWVQPANWLSSLLSEKQLRLNSILKRRDHPRRPPIQSHCV